MKAVLAESFDRTHRSNLVGMGIIPLQFMEGTTLESLGLSGKEKFSFDLPNNLTTSMDIKIKVSLIVDKETDTVTELRESLISELHI